MLITLNFWLLMIGLPEMQVFVLTVELKNLSVVARRLSISPAAISKQLTKLEETLCVQLLIRTTRKIEVTDVGAKYYEQCKRIFEEVDASKALISQVKAAPSGVLRVVSGRHFALSYIVPHIKEFLTMYPEIHLDLELAERIPDLTSEAIDVVIGMSVSATSDAIQKTIGATSYCFCASPEYLRQFGTPEKPKDLKKHRYITHSKRMPDDQLRFSNKQVITLDPYIRVNDVQTMLQLALDGLGIVKLHHYVVEEQLEQGLLQQVLSDYSTESVPLYVAYPPRRFVPAKVRCFIDFTTSFLQ